MRRVLFYCQFRHSLGHLARTRLIADAVLATGEARCSVLFGGRRPPGLALDPRLEVVEMPDLEVSEGALHLAPDRPEGRLLAERSARIRDHVLAEAPDAVLVDYLPLGLGGELMEALLAEGPTCWVWGVPYPGPRRPAPRNPRVRQALARYHAAFAYSSPGWLDPFETYQDYGLPERRTHVGVVVADPLPRLPSEVPVVVGLAGAGIGAASLFERLLEVSAPLAREGRIRLRLVAGIFHEAADVVERARQVPNVEVLERGSAEATTRDAALVVSRAGYNTAFSLARLEVPVVFVPWPSPDPLYTEQYDRARALATLPGIRWVDERAPSYTEALREALHAGLAEGPAARALPFSCDGAREAARLLLQVGSEVSLGSDKMARNPSAACPRGQAGAGGSRAGGSLGS